MKYKDFWDLQTTVMSKIKMAYVSTDPGATNNVVIGTLDVLDKIGALNWPLNKGKCNVCACDEPQPMVEGSTKSDSCLKCHKRISAQR